MVTLAAALGLARLLRTERTTALLIGVGTAICGGSAIAAVAPAIGAKSEQSSLALAVVFLLNALALLIFPKVGTAVGLTPEQFGLWCALAIHDTSSVVGASLVFGKVALAVGTTVKLARAVVHSADDRAGAGLARRGHPRCLRWPYRRRRPDTSAIPPRAQTGETHGSSSLRGEPNMTGRSSRSMLQVIGCLVLSSCTVIANYERGAFKDMPIRVRPLQLPNGLQVIVEEDTGSPMVAVALAVGVGSWSDPPGKEGLAHFVEHLAYRARLDGGQTPKEALAAAGVVNYNGETAADTTTYMAQGPRDAVSALIAIVARQLAGVGPIEGSTFEVERRVVEAELLMDSDTSHGQNSWRWLQEALYPPGPQGRVGTPESVRSLTLADVQAFEAAYYRPTNATLVITGGVSAAAVTAALSRAFPSPATPAIHQAMEHPTVLPPDPPPTRLHRRHAPLTEDRLLIAWSLPTKFQNPATSLWLGHVVDDWVASFIHEESQISEAQCFLDPELHAASLSCGFTLRTGTDPQRVFDFVTSRLENKMAVRGYSTTPSPSKEPQVTSVLLSAMERAALRARRAQVDGELLLNSKVWPPFSTEEHARELKWVTSARARAVSVTPGGVRSASRDDGTAIMVSTSGPSTSTTLTPAQVKQLATPLGTQRADLEQLENGLQLTVLKSKRSPLIGITLLLPGGTSLSEPPGIASLGFSLGRTNVSGLGMPTGAIQKTTLTRDGLQFTLLGQHENLEAMLRWLAFTMQGLWHVDSRTLSNLRFLVDAEIDEEEKRPLVRASRAFEHALWQGHPYGEESTKRMIDEPTTLQIEAWLNRLYGPNQAVLTVVGDVDVDRTLARIRELFSGLPKRTPIAAPPHTPPVGSSRVLATAIPGMTQVGLSWGCQIGTPGPRQEAITQLLGSWLDAQLNSRLREQAGLTYWSQVSSVSLWGGNGALTARLEARGSELGAVLKQLTLALTGDDLAQPALLSSAWDTLRLRNGRYEWPTAIALDLARDARNGWPLTSRDDAPGTMASVTVDEVRAALAECRRAAVMMLTGERATIEAGVREAGLGAAEFIP